MEDVKIKLSALWVARMLSGFLGDVLRYMQPGILEKLINGNVDGMEITHELLFISALIMVLPILMVYLSLTLKDSLNQWLNIGIAIFFFCFDFVGLIMFTSSYEIVVIGIGLLFNILTVWHAWKWRSENKKNISN